MLRKNRLLLAGALLVVGGAAVGIAYAAIPNGGVINGCYATSNGSLRVIDPTSATCKSSETALNWDAHGTQGPSGRPVQPGERVQRVPRGQRGRQAQRALQAPKVRPGRRVPIPQRKRSSVTSDRTRVKPPPAPVSMTASWVKSS